MITHSDNAFAQLAVDIKRWGQALGFAEIGITDTELGSAEHEHQAKDSWEVIHQPNQAFISRYALGRDYHKVVRQKLQQLCNQIASATQAMEYRVFTDSAPVLEVALAEKAGLGWRGKHTLLINKDHGSWFFLGEIYTDLPLPIDAPASAHCGTCNACLDICPSKAIVAPYEVDARRCISYLTIELKTAIPVEFRKLIGNRVYGCDDCQLICPWNKFAETTKETDFHVRHGLDDIDLVTCFAWTEAEFQQKMAGSAIYRIGYGARTCSLGAQPALTRLTLTAIYE
jgi:epoxyqueuosine reductase